MKRAQTSHSSRPLLKWILCKGQHLITCQVERAGDRFQVSVLPDGTRDRGLVRLFDAGLTAFQRHAALVADLRGTGWTLVAYR